MLASICGVLLQAATTAPVDSTPWGLIGSGGATAVAVFVMIFLTNDRRAQQKDFLEALQKMQASMTASAEAQHNSFIAAQAEQRTTSVDALRELREGHAMMLREQGTRHAEGLSAQRTDHMRSIEQAGVRTDNLVRECLGQMSAWAKEVKDALSDQRTALRDLVDELHEHNEIHKKACK